MGGSCDRPAHERAQHRLPAFGFDHGCHVCLTVRGLAGRSLSRSAVDFAGLYEPRRPARGWHKVGMIGAVVVGSGKPDGAAYAVTTNAGPVTQAGSSETAIEPQAVRAAVTPTSWAPAAWGIGLLSVAAAAIAASRRRRARGTVMH